MNKYHVYLVGEKPKGPIKVGFSSSYRQRIGYLQTGSHLNLSLIKVWTLTYSNAQKLERAAHKELNGSKLKGEWFSCPPHYALRVIEDIKRKTRGFRDWKLYQTSIRTKPWLDNAASIGGRARAKQAEQLFWQKFAVIQDRWHSNETSKSLMKEAQIRHHDTIRSYLGYTRWEWRRLTDKQRERVLKRKSA